MIGWRLTLTRIRESGLCNFAPSRRAERSTEDGVARHACDDRDHQRNPGGQQDRAVDLARDQQQHQRDDRGERAAVTVLSRNPISIRSSSGEALPSRHRRGSSRPALRQLSARFAKAPSWRNRSRHGTASAAPLNAHSPRPKVLFLDEMAHLLRCSPLRPSETGASVTLAIPIDGRPSSRRPTTHYRPRRLPPGSQSRLETRLEIRPRPRARPLLRQRYR